MTVSDAHALLDPFIPYYNQLRPHQGAACQNRIPDEAFPSLPTLPSLPERVAPNTWLTVEDKRIYQRRVNTAGSIQVDRHPYYVGQAFAGALILVHLDAPQARFHISLNGAVIKVLDIKGLHPTEMTLLDYVEVLKTEARLIHYFRAMHWHKTGAPQ